MSSNHAKYLDADINLLNLDFLVISETWLTSNISNTEVINKLDNWKVLKRLDSTDNKKHMGLLLLTPNKRENTHDVLYSLDYLEGYKSSNGNLLYQGLVMDIKTFYRRAVFLYIRETPNSRETIELTKSLRTCDWIIGDLNLNPKIPEQRKQLLKICGTTKFMALEEITTVNDTQLEHVIIEKELEKNSFATSYFNLASDHKSIAFRISSSANCFTSAFKQKITFNSDEHMRKTPSKSKKGKSANKRNEKEDRKERSDKAEFINNSNLNHIKILHFINPPNINLCFANAIVNAFLNISMINQLLSEDTDQMNLFSSKNRIIEELILLNNLPNGSMASTERLRSTVSSICEKSGQTGRSFNDNSQHDAGEFLVSMFEHLFKDSIVSSNIDEQIFGGLYQEKIVCKCGNIKYLPIQKLSEILMIQLHGHSIQSCLTNFLSDETVNNECTKCENTQAVKNIEIVTEPSTLIIQLKRYKYNVDERKVIKKHDEIKCQKSLTMPSGSTFTLSSIVNHIGSSPNRGHYNVIIYDHINDSFVLLDDLNATYDVENNSKISELCYIVTFKRC